MEFIEISSEEVRNKTPKQIVEELKQKLRIWISLTTRKVVSYLEMIMR